MRGRECRQEGRKSVGSLESWKERCIVFSPRHDFIRPWIRAYFSYGNTIPLVIVPGPPGDWRDDDMEYCKAAAEYSGGIVFDCSSEWKDSRRLAARAVRKNNVGWFTKKSILHAVSTRLSPRSWAWIDDDAEVTGDLDECFEYAEKCPGFILTQFYCPDSIDNRHPARMYRSNIDTGDKICWNSLVFFHGEANRRIAEELGKDFPVEDDEIVFGYLYQTNPKWHDGFCDFSIRGWQANCKTLANVPKTWGGKLLHYTTNRNNREVKKMWAAKATSLPEAPFEKKEKQKVPIGEANGPVDAVFVIGKGSVNSNEELRYALRNIEKHCPFVRDVYICGECPNWVDKSIVRHLQWPDRFSHAKDANIIDKLRHACEHPGIAKRILFCSDDQFQTRVCTWDDFAPRYLRRYTSSDRWYSAKRRVWHSRLRKTLEREVERRRDMGLDTKDVFYFQPHIWMPIDRDSFIEYAKWCGYERRDDTIIASGYFNFISANGKPDFDHVFIGNNEKGIPKATHVAYHDPSFRAAIGILKMLFPDKCRFEVGCDQNERRECAPPEQKGAFSGYAIYGGDDPSPAKPDEMGVLLSVMASIRDNPVWNSLLGEVSRAEELRLFGVVGWRTVWRDIVRRWSDETKSGSENKPVTSRRSEEASRIVNRYISDPDSVRTVRYGPRMSQSAFTAKSDHERAGVPVPASEETRTSLHKRIRSIRMLPRRT